jgi:hypothetical protein
VVAMGAAVRAGRTALVADDIGEAAIAGEHGKGLQLQCWWLLCGCRVRPCFFEIQNLGKGRCRGATLHNWK